MPRVTDVPTISARTPVVIGVGQVQQRVDDPSEAADATVLMANAIRSAAADATSTGDPIRSADVLAIVHTLSWRYGDPARVVADRLGISPRRVVTLSLIHI